MVNKSKNSQDPNVLAKMVVDTATGQAPKKQKDPIAVELGRRGGLKGGKSRKDSLTPKRRKEIARHAAKERWKKK